MYKAHSQYVQRFTDVELLVGPGGPRVADFVGVEAKHEPPQAPEPRRRQRAQRRRVVGREVEEELLTTARGDPLRA